MDEDVTSVHITKGLTSSTILDLIEEYPNLEEITCCPKVFLIGFPRIILMP